MRTFILATVALLMAGPAFANCNIYGNCYTSSGGTTYGSNSRTGSSWSSQSYGSTQQGTDSRGNSWSYDRNSGVYQNYGTGESRYHTPSTGTTRRY